MFDSDGFMAYLREQFEPMDNHFTHDMVENLVDYGNKHHSHTKDALAYFLSDIIPEVEFGEVAMFMDDDYLTYNGRMEKRKAILKTK